MNFLKEKRQVIMSVVAITLGFLGVLLAVISLAMSRQMNQELKRTADILDDVQQRTEVVAERTEVTFAVWSLWAVNWPDYIQACKLWAANQNPRLLEPLPQNEYKLTEEGRNLVSTDDMQRIIGIVEDERDVAVNVALLKFGVERLYQRAEDRGVEFEAFVGVFTGYVEEIKQQSGEQ